MADDRGRYGHRDPEHQDRVGPHQRWTQDGDETSWVSRSGEPGAQPTPSHLHRPEDEPPPLRAGHRSGTALGLALGVIGPSLLAAFVLWLAVGADPEPYWALLLLGGAFSGVVLPYAVGWERAAIANFAGLAVVGLVPHWLAGENPWLVGLACVAGIGVVALPVWWSLRLGRVRKPADARPVRGSRNDIWPYPYA